MGICAGGLVETRTALTIVGTIAAEEQPGILATHCAHTSSIFTGYSKSLSLASSITSSHVSTASPETKADTIQVC